MYPRGGLSESQDPKNVVPISGVSRFNVPEKIEPEPTVRRSEVG